MSCGAALHHLLVALADAGQGARVRRIPDPARPYHLATVEPALHVDVDIDAGLVAAIDHRRTDRRPFRAWPVPPELTGSWPAIADRFGVGLAVVTDPRTRHQLFRAIEEAARTQDADPAYVAELAAWSGRARGAPATACRPTAPRPPAGSRGGCRCGPFAGEAAPGPATGEPESAALLLLSTSADDPAASGCASAR